VGLGLLPGTAQAGLVTFEYSDVLSGDVPRGSSPWLTATFSDGPAANEVRLTLAAAGLSRGEFVSTWLFNLDPDLDPRWLRITPTDGLDPSRIRERADRFRRGGARFDVAISFPTEHRDRFDGDDTSELLISLRAGAPPFALTPESFAFTSQDGRERTLARALTQPRALFTAAHIQGIERCDDDDSAWVTADPALQPPGEPVPEPGTLLLVGSGVLGLAGLCRRRVRG
jgi:hypothetical protein